MSITSEFLILSVVSVSRMAHCSGAAKMARAHSRRRARDVSTSGTGTAATRVARAVPFWALTFYTHPLMTINSRFVDAERRFRLDCPTDLARLVLSHSLPHHTVIAYCLILGKRWRRQHLLTMATEPFHVTSPVHKLYVHRAISINNILLRSLQTNSATEMCDSGMGVRKTPI